MLFMSCVCQAFVSVHCCLAATCWEWAELLVIVCDVSPLYPMIQPNFYIEELIQNTTSRARMDSSKLKMF